MFDFGFIQDPAFALCFKKLGFHCVLPSPPCPYLSPPPPWSHYVAQTVLKLLYRPGVSVSWVLGLKMFPAFSADFLTQQWIFSSYLPCPTFFSCLKTFFSVLCMCVYLWESIHRCLWQPEEGIRFPWAGVRGSCGLGTELGPLQEQYGILTAEPSVRSFYSFFIVNFFTERKFNLLFPCINSFSWTTEVKGKCLPHIRLLWTLDEGRVECYFLLCYNWFSIRSHRVFCFVKLLIG